MAVTLTKGGNISPSRSAASGSSRPSRRAMQAALEALCRQFGVNVA